MSDSDLPGSGTVEDTPMSTRQGDEAIGNLLSDLISDPGDADETAQAPDAQAAPSPDEGETDDEGLVIDDEGEGLESDAPDETEFKGGRFASDDAKVKLEDGSTISVAELKRNNLFQRDYSKKTEELARKSESVDAKDRQISELSNVLAVQRQNMEALAKRYVPQPPNPELLNTDPMGYMQARADFEQRAAEYNRFFQSIEQEKTIVSQKQRQEADAKAESEITKFVEQVPALKAPGRLEAWASETTRVLGEAYGISGQELLEFKDDSRFLMAMNDLVRFRKALAKREQSKAPPQQQQQKPRIPPQQRMSQTPQQRDSTNAIERLRKSGSARDAEAALLKFL